MPSIAVIGPGAIGGTLASFLLENPKNSVSICARSAFESLHISAAGNDRSYRPPVHLAPDQLEPVDWIVLATKTYQVSEASAWLAPLSDERTRLAVVQNGVEHVTNLAPYFDPSRLAPVIIDCPATRQAPGRIARHGDVYMAVPKSPIGSAFASLFTDPAVTVDLVDDWTTPAWKKLCLNCAGAVCALVNRPANIAQDPTAARVMENLIRECIAVGRAEGARLDDSLVASIIASQAAAPDGAMNSLHSDLVARRPMESDARNGIIARRGAEHGIPTPYNQLATDLLSLLESKP